MLRIREWSRDSGGKLARGPIPWIILGGEPLAHESLTDGEFCGTRVRQMMDELREAGDTPADKLAHDRGNHGLRGTDDATVELWLVVDGHESARPSGGVGANPLVGFVLQFGDQVFGRDGREVLGRLGLLGIGGAGKNDHGKGDA